MRQYSAISTAELLESGRLPVPIGYHFLSSGDSLRHRDYRGHRKHLLNRVVRAPQPY